MKDHCFVCGEKVDKTTVSMNSAVGLPVCKKCKGTQKEKKAEEEYLDSLADGLVCGCI